MRQAWMGMAAAATMLVAGCGEPEGLRVDSAWIRLPAVTSRPGVAYFTVRGGPEAATLINVSSSWAVRTDMHESMGSGGMMTMKPLDRVAVPANGTLVFAPGGKHLMVHGINPAVHAGDTMTFTFTFADGQRIRRIARVYGAGDAGPA